MFSRAEGLEREQEKMKELSKRLASINRTDDRLLLDEAKQIMTTLSRANRRWNILALSDFLKKRRKELFL